MQICEFEGNVSSTPAVGDTSVTIADLAMFLHFDLNDAEMKKTSVPIMAYNALIDEYGAFEKTGGAFDYYEGCWMQFSDGSVIRINEN
jgi:hypothetical protein